MFNDKFGLTNAVIERRKTNTRRLCKDKATNKLILASEVYSWRYYPEENIVEFVMTDDSVKVSVPPYKVGEVVAVAQSYKDAGIDPHFLMFQPIKGSTYFAEMEIEAMFTGGWNNKMFVRAELMPHQIRITDIKVERLQDISEEDCLKEGIQEYFPYIDRDPNDKVRTFRYFKDGKIRHCISPASKCFAHLIDDISGKGTWDSNPYVFAYTFELIK